MARPGESIPSVLLTIVGLTWLFRHRVAGRLGVLAVTSVVAARLLIDLATYLPQPDFPAGLLRLSPALVFALLPSAPGWRPTSVRTATMAICGGYLAGTLAFAATDGGAQYGPRLLLPILPMLAVAAWEGMQSYEHRGQDAYARTIWAMGLALYAGSVLIQVGVGVRVYAGFNRVESRAIAWIDRSPDSVLVIDSPFTISVVEPVYSRRRVMLAADQSAADTLAHLLGRNRIQSFLLVSREDVQRLSFPGFEAVEQIRFGRTTVQRWRDPSVQ